MKKALSLYLLAISVLIQPISVLSQKSRLLSRESQESFANKVADASIAPASSEYSGLSAIAAEGAVLIRWQMKSETNIVGYYIHRIDSNGDALVNEDVVLGSATKVGDQTVYGGQYAYVDRYGSLSSVYYVQALEMSGKSFNSTTITPFPAKRFPIDVSKVPTNEVSEARLQSQSLKSADLRLPKEISASLEEFAALQPDINGQQYVVRHPGARIDVKAEGIYRVTFSQLQAAGFDIDAPMANWQLYLNGVQQAITINANAGYVEFYGKGIDTVESDIQGYFLIVGETAGKRIQNLVARPSTSTVIQPSYNQTFQYKERINYLNQILNGPAENYFGRLITSTGMNVTFDLQAIDYNLPNSQLQIKIQGFSSGLHNIRPTLNGQVLSNLTGVAQFPMSISLQVPTSLLRDRSVCQCSNTLNIATTASSDFNVFDSISLSFARKQAALDNTLKAYALNNKKSTLTGFSSANVRVFDISNESDIREMTNLPFTNQNGSFGTVLPAARGKVYYAVEDSSIRSPFAVVNNDGEVLSSSGNGADLLIIAHKSFLSEAQQWADYRSAQGISVEVVNVDEIYNEFGFGVFSSDSIEAFLNYASNSWNPKPGYVLLIGDASWDSRNFEGDGYFNYIPPRAVTTVFEETASDEALADFDNDGLAEMAIGRIPARWTHKTFTAADVTSANDSIRILSHGFAVGTKISLATTGTLPADLSTAETYYAIVVDSNNIRLASSLENAQAGTPVEISDAIGSGTHTLKAYPFMIATSLAKVMKWESNLPADPLSRGFLLFSHWDPDTLGLPENEDPETLFQEMSKRLRDELPPNTPVTLMNNASSPKADLIASVNTGKYFVNYSGHGALSTWVGGNPPYFSGDDVPMFINHDSESVFTMLTCLNGQFNNLRGVSLAELLLDSKNGGAVAAWSSTGKTTPEPQEVMARRFYNQLGQGNITRLGALIKDAKSVLIGGSDVRLSWVLLGDPMLKVR